MKRAIRAFLLHLERERNASVHTIRAYGQDLEQFAEQARTDLGREIMSRMIADGTLESRPGDSDPGAIALMRRLAENSRARWPTSAAPEVRLGLPTKK